MGRAQKYALIQSQVLFVALMAVVVYLIATKFSLALGFGLLVYQVAIYGWIVAKIRRDREDDG